MSSLGQSVDRVDGRIKVLRAAAFRHRQFEPQFACGLLDRLPLGVGDEVR